MRITRGGNHPNTESGLLRGRVSSVGPDISGARVLTVDPAVSHPMGGVSRIQEAVRVVPTPTLLNSRECDPPFFYYDDFGYWPADSSGDEATSILANSNIRIEMKPE